MHQPKDLLKSLWLFLFFFLCLLTASATFHSVGNLYCTLQVGRQGYADLPWGDHLELGHRTGLGDCLLHMILAIQVSHTFGHLVRRTDTIMQQLWLNPDISKKKGKPRSAKKAPRMGIKPGINRFTGQ